MLGKLGDSVYLAYVEGEFPAARCSEAVYELAWLSFSSNFNFLSNQRGTWFPDGEKVLEICASSIKTQAPKQRQTKVRNLFPVNSP